MQQGNIVQILHHKRDKSRFFETWLPWIRFQIPSELGPGHYMDFLNHLFADFIRSLSGSQANRHHADGFYFGNFGDEGGVGGIYIREKYFADCKLFAYDGTSQQVLWAWKGILMANHLDMRSKVKSLYELAEEFEMYLYLKKIPYQRFGRKVTSSDEQQQETHWIESE